MFRRFGSLRWRLFGSYFLLLVVTLGVGAGVLVAALSSRPEPSVVGYQGLVQLARSIVSDTTRQDVGRLTFDQLQDQAELYGSRILVVRWSNRKVSYDSAGVFASGTPINLYIDPDYRVSPGENNARSPLADGVFGSLRDPDNTEWLFIGIRTGPVQDLALLLAEQRSTRTLQESLAEFSGSLAGPILQAALFGLGVAFILAAIISGQLIKQLSALGGAARAVAGGDYSHQIPQQGTSEIQAVADAFNSMVHEVQSTQQAQRDFLANVSHDLKTPLTSIQGYAQAIIDDAIGDPVVAAEIIYSEADRLTRMVLELTDLARLQGGRVALTLDAIDMTALCQALAQRIEVVARKKGVDITVHAPGKLTVNADGDRMAQVITNLLSNAVKFTPEGGHIAVGLQPFDHGVEISVQDTGIGIPQTELARVFERFYQVDKARGPQRGLGLGLAISREIVVAHGGRITANSTGEGHGTTFTIWLPHTPPI